MGRKIIANGKISCVMGRKMVKSLFQQALSKSAILPWISGPF